MSGAEVRDQASRRYNVHERIILIELGKHVGTCALVWLCLPKVSLSKLKALTRSILKHFVLAISFWTRDVPSVILPIT
jgi:hypothetical protein